LEAKEKLRQMEAKGTSVAGNNPAPLGEKMPPSIPLEVDPFKGFGSKPSKEVGKDKPGDTFKGKGS
jgi:hypothetical protein